MLKIREYRDSDLNAMHRILSQKSNYQETFKLPAPSLEQIKRRNNQFLSTKNQFILVIEHKGDRKVIGHAALYQLEAPLHHCARFSLNIDENYRSIGAASALLTELIHFSKNKLKIKKLVLTVYAQNSKAINLYKKFNFKEDGILKQFALRNGKYVDAYHMSLELN